jgi:hypothetical protein
LSAKPVKARIEEMKSIIPSGISTNDKNINLCTDSDTESNVTVSDNEFNDNSIVAKEGNGVGVVCCDNRW